MAATSRPRPSNCRSPTAPAARPALLRITPGDLAFAPGEDGAQLIVEETHRAGSPARPDGRGDLGGRAGGDRDDRRRGLCPAGRGGQGDGPGPSRRSRRPTATVRVEAAAERAWDFGEDIVPILTRAGCNTGGCHGKADGQNGFHLSLFGYDPAGDYRASTRDGARPPVDRLDARGEPGPRQGDRPDAARGRAAVRGRLARVPDASGLDRGGCARDARARRTAPWSSSRVEPADVRLDEPGPLQFRVVARYADGHERDVTRLATFRVNDDSAASIDAQRPGRPCSAAPRPT